MGEDTSLSVGTAGFYFGGVPKYHLQIVIAPPQPRQRYSPRSSRKNACWKVAVIGTMVGSHVFILSSNSFMQNHPAAVTSAFPNVKVVASESQRKKYTSSKQLQPPKHACSIGTHPKNCKSFSTQVTPNSSASSRTAVDRDLSPLSMCPATPISHISGNVSLLGERFCSTTIPRSGSMRHTRTLRCHIFSLCTNPLGLDSPVGTARSMYISKPAVGGSMTSKISDADCATASAFGLCDFIARRGLKTVEVPLRTLRSENEVCVRAFVIIRLQTADVVVPLRRE